MSEGPGEFDGEEFGGVELAEGAVKEGEFAEGGAEVEESEFGVEESGELLEGLDVVVAKTVVGLTVRIVERIAILLE